MNIDPNLILKLLGPLAPAAKAVVIVALGLIAAIATAVANGSVDVGAISTAIGAFAGALIVYLVPNAKPAPVAPVVPPAPPAPAPPPAV